MLEEIENFAVSFDKVAEKEHFFKDIITRFRAYEAKIDLQNCLVAISKNGGLIAFVKKYSLFLMNLNDPIKDYNFAKEIRIPFKHEQACQIALFDFTNDERLIAILKNGLICKFDISTKSFTTKKTGNNFENDNIDIVKLFDDGFVAMTQKRNFYLIKSIKEPVPLLFFPFAELCAFDVRQNEPISDFIFIPEEVSASGKIELLFTCPRGHGIVHVIEHEDNQFNVSEIPKSDPKAEDVAYCEGVNYIRSLNEEPYTKKSGKDDITTNDLGKICAFALSPSEEEIAMYRRDGTVFFFNSNLKKGMRKVNYTINEKDSDKDKKEQREVIGFCSNTKFLFCGNDAVCLSGKRFVILITHEDKTLIYKISNKPLIDPNGYAMQCVTEIDGLRVLGNDAMFFIYKVPKGMFDVCYTFSNDSSKKLIKAYKKAEEGNVKGDIEIRSIKENLAKAVECVQRVSAEFWKKDIQLFMLKAARHGKDFAQREEVNIKEFVEICKDIRIINNLRSSEIPRFITFTEYRKMRKKELIKRLMRTEDFYMAFEISKYLDLNMIKIYQKFATTQIKKFSESLTREEEIEHFNLLYHRISKIEGISYLKLAEKAFKCHKKRIGLKFLEKETSVLIKIPQYLELGEWDKAFQLAIITDDYNIIANVINKIYIKEEMNGLCELADKYEEAHPFIVRYFKEYSPNHLEDYFYAQRKFEDLFFYALENFFNSVDIKDKGKLFLSIAQRALNIIANDKVLSQKFDAKFYQSYLTDLDNSIKLKKKLIDENEKLKEKEDTLINCSLYDVLYEDLKIDVEDSLERKTKEMEISKIKINIIRLRVAAEENKKEILKNLINIRKNCGLQTIHFAEILLDEDLKEEAAKVIRTDIEETDYFDYKLDILKYMGMNNDALEFIIREKNLPEKAELVNELLSKFPKLSKKCQELKEKYKVNF